MDDIEDILDEGEVSYGATSLLAVNHEPKVPAKIKATSEEAEVRADDVVRLNSVFDMMDWAVHRVITVEDACKVALTMTKVMAERRKILGLKYGSPSVEGSQNVYDPYDD